MSWIADDKLTWCQRLTCHIIKSGKVPQHIGVIMDGNRRYEKKHSRRNANGAWSDIKGFKKISELVRWCFISGVRQVTIYGFSLENFKRSAEEIQKITTLSELALKGWYDGSDKILNEDIRFKSIGDPAKIPSPLSHKYIGAALRNTKHKKGMILTLAAPYTSTDEITTAVRSIVKGIEDGELELEDISQGLVEKCLYTEDGYPVDLLIRTSGEVRFSNFMLWQQSCSSVYFCTRTWPEFTIWDFLKAIFHYQRTFDTLSKVKEMENDTFVENERIKKFLTKLYQTRYDAYQI